MQPKESYIRNLEQIDSFTAEIIADVVLDWLNKYPLEFKPGGDNYEGLSITDPENVEQIKFWVMGVWGRITHQLLDSGISYSNERILNIAINTLHNQLKKHPWYEKIKPYLPQKTRAK